MDAVSHVVSQDSASGELYCLLQWGGGGGYVPFAIA